jgi:hypothetical protein
MGVIELTVYSRVVQNSQGRSRLRETRGTDKPQCRQAAPLAFFAQEGESVCRNGTKARRLLQRPERW